MIRFGDFSFEPATGELTRGTAVERLAPQAAQVLRLLLERPGEVISREEFRRVVWPDTTVEFDQGLNFCIRQLRIALGDDAAHPLFIETLPRRGYRFNAPVTAPGGVLEPAENAAAKRPHDGRRLWSIGLGGALVVVVSAVIAWASRRATSPPPILAIVPFDADTSLPALENYRDALGESMLARATTRASRSVVIIGPALTSIFGARTPIDTIHARIGATYALSGAVRRRAEAVDVFAQLVRASDRGHIWAIRMLDSSGSDYAHIGARIADSVAAILSEVRVPRRPLGYDDRVTKHQP